MSFVERGQKNIYSQVTYSIYSYVNNSVIYMLLKGGMEVGFIDKYVHRKVVN